MLRHAIYSGIAHRALVGTVVGCLDLWEDSGHLLDPTWQMLVDVAAQYAFDAIDMDAFRLWLSAPECQAPPSLIEPEVRMHDAFTRVLTPGTPVVPRNRACDDVLSLLAYRVGLETRQMAWEQADQVVRDLKIGRLPGVAANNQYVVTAASVGWPSSPAYDDVAHHAETRMLALCADRIRETLDFSMLGSR